MTGTAPGFAAIDGEEAETIAKDKPVQADAGPVLLGVDHEKVVSDVATKLDNYVPGVDL